MEPEELLGQLLHIVLLKSVLSDVFETGHDFSFQLVHFFKVHCILDDFPGALDALIESIDKALAFLKEVVVAKELEISLQLNYLWVLVEGELVRLALLLRNLDLLVGKLEDLFHFFVDHIH